jgi:hypothetical protein
MPDDAGGWHVRPATQVQEFALLVKGYRRMFGQSLLDVFDLERLPQVAANIDRIAARAFDSLERPFKSITPHLGRCGKSCSLNGRGFHIVIKPPSIVGPNAN